MTNARNMARADIQALGVYSPPLDGRHGYDGLLLDFNERSYPPSKKARQAIAGLSDLQRYPEYGELTVQLAKYAQVDPTEIMATNGSDRALDVVFRTFTEKGDKVIIPSPSFPMFYQYAQVAGNEIIQPRYGQDDGAFPLQAVLEAADDRTKLILVCNPNNPTGTLVPIKDIEHIAQQVPDAIILVDEAYFEFSGVTAVELIKTYPNVVVTRTFSKAFGLAALRAGYVMATPQHIHEMLKVRGPYDVNMAAVTAVMAALDDPTAVQVYVDEVVKQSKPLIEDFFTKHDILFYPTAANFIFFRPTEPATVYKELAEHHILTRPQPNAAEGGMLRLTIGTKAEMERFIQNYPL